MSEKEKMLGGLIYNPVSDDELVRERTLCKELCAQYNALPPVERQKRIELIRKITKTDKDNFLIEQTFWCDYGYNIKFGDNFYSNHGLVVLDPAKVEFGDNVFIGPNCGFYTAIHPIDPKERAMGLEIAKPIRVGSNVWFGGNVVVLPGVNIEDNVVIGAGSVVTKDIPSNVVAVGNPCKVLREIKEGDKLFS